jgi:hypothetical protein
VQFPAWSKDLRVTARAALAAAGLGDDDLGLLPPGDQLGEVLLAQPQTLTGQGIAGKIHGRRFSRERRAGPRRRQPVTGDSTARRRP